MMDFLPQKNHNFNILLLFKTFALIILSKTEIIKMILSENICIHFSDFLICYLNLQHLKKT